MQTYISDDDSGRSYFEDENTNLNYDGEKKAKKSKKKSSTISKKEAKKKIKNIVREMATTVLMLSMAMKENQVEGSAEEILTTTSNAMQAIMVMKQTATKSVLLPLLTPTIDQEQCQCLDQVCLKNQQREQLA